MHAVVRDRLEDLLRADQSKPLPEHLASCKECLSELNMMKSQSMKLAGLRAAQELEPSPGFYARVLQRIEESEYDSFWAFFVYSPFSKRLAAASLTIALALGTYVVSQESRTNPVSGSTVASLTGSLHYDAPVVGSPDEQRDAVLQNFTEHRTGENQGQKGQIR
jgi:hypothetical protein